MTIYCFLPFRQDLLTVVVTSVYCPPRCAQPTGWAGSHIWESEEVILSTIVIPRCFKEP